MFRRWAELVVARPVSVLLIVLLLTVVVGAQARHLRLDIRESDQMPQDHPYVQLYNRINERFGGGAVVVIGVVPVTGDIFNRDTLSRIERITRQVEALAEVAHGSVLSLASPRVKTLASNGDDIDVHALMPEVPEHDEDLQRLRAEVEGDDLYTGTLVAAGGAAAAVILEVPVDVSYPLLHRQLEDIVAAERNASTQIVLAGGPIVFSYLDRYTAQMAILFPIAVLVIALVHYEAFRTVQAMVLPLVTALLSVLWALGVMGAWQAPLDTWSSIAPVAILAVAAGHAVQILKRYYEEYARHGDNREAIVASIENVGPVMLMAGLIAAAGFASLATFDISSIQVFGLLMASGILSALFIEMTFIPACRMLLGGPARREAARERESRWLTPILQHLAEQVVQRPRAVLAVAVGVMLLSAGGIATLRVDSSLRGYFAAGSQLRRDDAVINEKFAGASVLKVLLEGHAEGALQQPEVLRAIDDLQAFLQRVPEVGKTLSVADYVKRMHRALAPQAARAAAIPDREALIAQYLLLYSLSGQPDDLSSLVDPTYRDGIVLVFNKSDAAAFVHALVDDLRTFAAQRFHGLPVSVGVAGGALGAQAAVNEVIVREKIRNLVQVACIIFLLAAVALRSLLGGLLVLSPLLIAVVVNFGVMGWSRTALSMTTASVTAMGVSIGADFAIYLIFRLREELAERALDEALHRTLLTCGKAIFFVSSAVTLGYLVLVFSGFAAWIHLGGFTALIMLVSSLAAVSVLPSLVMILKPRFLWPQARPV